MHRHTLLLPAAFITSLGNNIQLIGAALLLVRAHGSMLISVDESRVGHAFGVANGYGLAATVVVMLVTSVVTGRTDTRYGFATLVTISVLAVVWIRRSTASPRQQAAAVTHPTELI